MITMLDELVITHIAGQFCYICSGSVCNCFISTKTKEKYSSCKTCVCIVSAVMHERIFAVVSIL
jgi:hypothetical protein